MIPDNNYKKHLKLKSLEMEKNQKPKETQTINMENQRIVSGLQNKILHGG